MNEKLEAAAGHVALRYSLVIPAYNEEEAIAGTLRRALAAKEKVMAETGITEMVIVVVNDGSRDRTQEVIDQPEFEEIAKIRFPENRGYGAAIKAGFRAAPSDLLGFMDADGTCDPQFSVQLINRLLESDADVVLASRLGNDSKMPGLRRLGNRIFAGLLSVLAGRSVVDIASGFRVIRRSSLKLMSPLPNGLHFTPAMSCICALDPRLRIEEVPMHYEERIGRSKLKVIMDGIRFLYTILFSFLCYSPIKSALAANAVLLVLFGILMSYAFAFGARPVLLGSLAIGVMLLATLVTWVGLVVHQLNFLLIGPRRPVRRGEQILQKFLHYKGMMAGGGGITVAASLGYVALGIGGSGLSEVAQALVAQGLVVLLATGVAILTAGLVTRTIWAVGEKQKALVKEDYEPLGDMQIVNPRPHSGGPADMTHEVPSLVR